MQSKAIGKPVNQIIGPGSSLSSWSGSLVGSCCLSHGLGVAHGKCVVGTYTHISEYRHHSTGQLFFLSWRSLRPILMVTIKEHCVRDLNKTKAQTKYQIQFKTMQLAQITSWNYKWLHENVMIPLQNSKVLCVLFHTYFMLII